MRSWEKRESMEIVCNNKTITVKLHLCKVAEREKQDIVFSHYKDDEIGSGECYMLRYDGKIKPTFINFNDDKYNLQFFKRSMIVLDDKCEELDNSNFNKYIKSGYPPLYPSIGYCAYDSRRYTYEKNNKK